MAHGEPLLPVVKLSPPSKSEIEERSLSTLAQLEGGLLIARVQDNPALFARLAPKAS